MLYAVLRADCCRESWRWPWYCAQQDFISELLRKLVVGWLPSLLLVGLRMPSSV
jgi:hypothetical protein